jgi:hypothetical protein
MMRLRLGIDTQGQQDIARARPLQGNIHAHICAGLRIAQVAQHHVAAKGARPRALAVDQHLPSRTAFSQAQSLSSFEALTTTRYFSSARR